MRLAITGSLGMVGRATTDHALDRGHDVIGIDVRTVTGPTPCEQIVADIRVPGSLNAAFSGCDAIVHTASVVDLHLGRPAILDEVNVQGVENVVAAAKTAGVGRLIHMSSAEVITGPDELRGVSERSATYPARHLTHYGLTKQWDEERILAAADDDLGTAALRTYGIYGPHDRTVLRHYLGRMPGRRILMIGDLSERTDLIFSANLAHALVLAAEQLEPDVEWSGSALHVTDHEPLNLQRFLADLVAPLGYSVVTRPRIPQRVAAAAAHATEAIFARTGWERLAYPPLTHHSLLLATGNYWLDSSLIGDLLGYEAPVSRTDAVASTQEWLLGEYPNRC